MHPPEAPRDPWSHTPGLNCTLPSAAMGSGVGAGPPTVGLAREGAEPGDVPLMADADASRKHLEHMFIVAADAKKPQAHTREDIGSVEGQRKFATGDAFGHG